MVGNPVTRQTVRQAQKRPLPKPLTGPVYRVGVVPPLNKKQQHKYAPVKVKTAEMQKKRAEKAAFRSITPTENLETAKEFSFSTIYERKALAAASASTSAASTVSVSDPDPAAITDFWQGRSPVTTAHPQSIPSTIIEARDKLPDVPPIPSVLLWLLIGCIAAGFFLALKVYLIVVPQLNSKWAFLKNWVYNLRFMHPKRVEVMTEKDGCKEEDDGTGSNSTSSSLYEMPLPAYYPTSPPQTPITPLYTSTGRAASLKSPLPPHIATSSSVYSTPVSTPVTAMFAPRSGLKGFGPSSNTSLRRRHLPITPIKPPSPNSMSVDLESLTPLPTPRANRLSLGNYIPSPRRASPPKNQYSYNDPPSGWFGSTIDTVADTVARYTADTGGEQELLLPISKGEREGSEHLD